MCTQHQLLTPPPPAQITRRECTASFAGRRDQIRLVRALLTGFLDGCPSVDDAVLLASEISANAVAHSASGQPGGTFTLRAQITNDSSLRIEVEDRGSRWDGNVSAAVPPHGLYLLRALSHGHGTRRGACGWVTWFTLSIPATGQAPRP